MNKWQVFGHDWAVEMLVRHVVNDSLRHAYLITGPAGVGRHTLAVRLAQAINCVAPLEPGVPCRACRNCIQIEAGRNIDLMVIEAEVEGGILQVNQVREATRFLSLKPYASSHKVVFMLRFQEANAQAMNALLKTLEEAPAYAVIILTANIAEQLLPTIISRCEVLRLRPLGNEAMLDFLTLRGVASEGMDLLIHLAEGRPGYALMLSGENNKLQEFRLDTLVEMRKLIAARLPDRFKYAEKIARDKDVLRKILVIWLSYWRDVLLLASGARLDIANIDFADELQMVHTQMTLAQVRKVVYELDGALARLDKNVNARLLVEVLLMDWPRMQMGA